MIQVVPAPDGPLPSNKWKPRLMELVNLLLKTSCKHQVTLLQTLVFYSHKRAQLKMSQVALELRHFQAGICT